MGAVSPGYQAPRGGNVTFSVVQPKTLLTSSEEDLHGLVLTINVTKINDEFSAEDIILEILRLIRHLEVSSISSQKAVQWTTLKLFRFIVKWATLSLFRV